MQYTKQEMLNKDIDWTLQIGQYFLHAASAGGLLPAVIQNDKENNQNRFRIIRKLPDFYTNDQIEVNPILQDILNINEFTKQYKTILEALNIPVGEDVITTYISRLYIPAFQRFARKGFISFDRSNKRDTDHDFYHWVARPKSNPIRHYQLLKEIKLPRLSESILYEIIQPDNNKPIPLVELIDTMTIH